MIRTILYYPLIILSLLLFLRDSSAGDHIKVQFPKKDLPDAEVEVRQSGEMLYLDLEGFAKALNLRSFQNPDRHKFQFNIASIPLKWTADNAFVVIADEISQLPSEVIYQDGKYWAPLDAFMEIVRTNYPGRIQYNRYDWTLEIIPSSQTVFAVRYDEKDNGTLVRIYCTRKLNISQPAYRHDAVSITLMNADVDRNALLRTPPAGVVEKLLIEEHAQSVQLTFAVNAPILEHSVTQDEITNQILLTLVTNTEIPTNLSSEPVSNEDIELDGLTQALKREQEKWRVDCVVIDPGHGGKDPGAVGPTGLQEKEVTLDIALRLKQLIEKNTNLKVILTRQDDSFIGLNDRTRLANQKQGKLFISIHCNAVKSGGAGGFETYFLRPARNQKAMEVALRENSVIKYEDSHNQYQDLTEENYILLAMAQSEFVRESEALAGIVQTKLRSNTGLKDRGVDQAGFYVLVGASMPAILVETAFLTNKNEEKLLRTKKFRQQVAQALFESAVEFMKRTESQNDRVSISP
jgi:N-acetylmuramoyl-L-alanine amidase